MNFAINYSHPAAYLVDEGRIQIDRFKTPNWPHMVEQASAYRPVAVHFSFQAGRGLVSGTDWEEVNRLLEQTGTPYVNLHLSPTVNEFPGVKPDRPSSDQVELVVGKMLKDVEAVTRRFGSERVILENVPYQGAAGKFLRPAVEPECIHRILEETGCGLLLDISHARIAARALGMDERDYLSGLPVHRLRELHFTGLHWVDGRWQDHLPILAEDWPVLEWLLERITKGEWARPWMLVFEYGGVGGFFEERSDPAVIAEQAPRLYTMVKSV